MRQRLLRDLVTILITQQNNALGVRRDNKLNCQFVRAMNEYHNIYSKQLHNNNDAIVYKYTTLLHVSACNGHFMEVFIKGKSSFGYLYYTCFISLHV